MSYTSLPAFKLFQLTSLSCALALAGCGGDGVDSVKPPIPPVGGGGGNNGGGGDNGGTQTPVEDFSLQKLYTDPTNIKLTDEAVTFNVTVKAVTASGGAAINRSVSLNVDDSNNTGVTIQGASVQSTNDKGEATYELKLNPLVLNDEQKADLLLNGFGLKATAKQSSNGAEITQVLTVRVSKEGSGEGAQTEISKLNIENNLQTTSVSNNKLNPYGDTAKFNVIIKNTDGSRAADVIVGMGLADIKGIAIVEGNNKTTDINGIAVFKVKVDENLSKAERDKLLQGVAYAINIKEKNGASKKKEGTLPVAIPISDYQLAISGNSNKINAYGDSQTLIINASAINANVSTSINGAKGTIKFNNAIPGVKLSTEALTFDASGKATVNLIVAPTLTADQRKAIVEKGVSYTVVLSEPNRSVTTQTYVNEAYIPESQYQIKFATKNKSRISSFGSEVTISFRVNDKAGGAIANQTVTANLPIDLINKGLLSLDSAATQVTDSKGMVSYNVKVPVGLNAANRAELEKIGGFVLTAKVTETSGATSSIASERIQVTAESETILSVKNVPSAVNVLKNQFQIQVAGKRPDGSAAAAKKVKLTISNVAGISIQGSEQTTDESGNAVFTVNLSQDLTETQRQALVKSGIPYTVTLTDEDGVTTNTYKAPVIIPIAEYKLNFANSSIDKLLSTGGVTTLSFRVNDKNGGVIANQTVTASLPSNLTQKGLITLESAASQVTDAQGSVSYTVRIPAGLSVTQRAELEKAAGFKLNARLVESSGASINIDSNRIVVTADPSKSKTILTSTTTPSIVNLLKDQFTIQVSAKRPNGSAAASKSVKLAINNIKGISIEGGEQITNSAGNATFTVNIDKGLTLEQRKALEKIGVAYTATMTDDDGVATENYTVKAAVPNAEYKINFGSSSNAQLSSSGGSTVVSFRVNDKDGGVIGNQKVTVNLPAALVSAGLLTLDSAATQTTDNLGIVSYTVRIPSGLTTAQKTSLEKASGFFLTAKLIETSGASTSTNSAPIAISNKVQKSLTVLSAEANPEVVNVLKSQFTIKVSGKRKDGSAAADKVVKLELNNVAGVAVKDNEQKTDASGNATFTINVSQDLTQAQREALVKSGITYTASLTDNDGVVTSNYNASVIIPAAQYQINFGTSDKVQLSSSGGSTIISFRVNDKNGGVIANQSVTAMLPKSLVDSSLLTLDSAATQTTNSEGVVSYKVSIPAGLSTAKKKQLEEAGGFILKANAVESSGASSSISSSSIRITAAVEKSDIKLTSISSPKVVTVTDKQFTIQVSAKLSNGSVAAGKNVKLVIKDMAGVSIQGNEKVTNEAGNAVFIVNLSQDLTKEERAALVASGIKYNAVLTDDDGTEAKIENAVVEVVQPATSLEFASILTPSISEFGGKGTVSMKLLTKANQTPVKGQPVAIQLGKVALDYGVTVNAESATTDFSGETTFIVNIPEGLTAVQRAELKKVGIKYQLSYVEKDATYNSLAQKVNIITPAVDLTVINAPNLINNRPFYTLNGEGDTAIIQAALSTQNTSFAIAGQPIELEFKDKALAALLNVNGKLGSNINIVSTGDNGAASFTVTVPNNLTADQKDQLQNKRLTATFTETLTRKTQEIQFNIQSTKAAIDLIAIPPKALNLNGGETQIEVIAQDSKDNVIAGKQVYLALPAAIAAQGVSLVTSGTQTTDNSGKASFTLAVPAGLTDEQKAAIGSSFKVVLTAADANGNIATNTSTVTTSKPAASGTKEDISIGANKVINTKGDTFKVFVRVTNDKGSIANRDVLLNVDDPIKTGITITNNTVKTNGDGVATFDLKFVPGASVDLALLESGIPLTATTTTAEGFDIIENYIVAVDTATVDSYQILASSDKSTLNTGGDQTNATFRVTDSSGGILVGVPVQLSIDSLEASGAALTTPSIVTTDAEGKVDVGILLGANSINARLNHEVKITAKIVTPVYDANGNVSMDVREEKSLSLSATGTVMTLNASKTQLKDAEVTTINTTLIDGAGRAIANTKMDLVNADGQSVLPKDSSGAPMFATTDADGNASFELNEAALKTANTFDDNGNLRIYARAIGEKSLNTQTSINSINLVQVSQAGISFGNIENLYDVNVAQTINVQIRTDSAAEALALALQGKVVEVQTTIGTFGNNDVITSRPIAAGDITGNIITIPVVLTSKLSGSATLEAKVLGIFANGSSGALKYQTTADTRFRATTPAKMLFQAVKSVITPGSSTEIVATVKDKNDVPVEGQTVVFSRSVDSSAGRLSAATAVTDRKGEARVVYTANASSPIGGVVINGRLLNDSENIGTKTTNITVSEEAVYTTLAFANKLSSDDIYYTVRGSISVMDGSGRAVPNKEVSIKSYAIEYAQGLVCLLDSTTTYQAADEVSASGATSTPEPQTKSEKTPIFLQSGWKPTEDSNYNYTLDKDPILNEDKNGNDSLDAINPVAIIGGTLSDDGYTFVTDDKGRADFEIRYPLNYSNWVKVRFDATTFLNGSENSQSINYTLPSAESDLVINNTSIQTPWIDNTSPFGHGGAVCTSTMNVKIDAQNDTTQVILSPYQPNQPGYFVSIDGVNSNSSSIAYNSFVVDFNQAFDEGSRINVRRNGFEFSKNIMFK
ncbi:Ig-like domain-containing protein [Psychrobacter sp. DAB_AL32B]|uniref:Ig-like domain-containing protein n=1 Tax=Psychrobacter sp. DAB_AL32B TaxID=1028414 RepID=UPI000B7D9497|nr:Ig-like domain-containing protein [Psychrobacter sp. DAB_AL32B]OXL27126.1 hypothetical protein CAN34_02065 [Psychrobacter sp. DAB_AL32B]